MIIRHYIYGERGGVVSWKTPLVTNNVLTIIDTEDTRPEVAGRVIEQIDLADPSQWDAWQTFLTKEKSFRYKYVDTGRGIDIEISVFKEYRTQYGYKGKKYEPKPYWYAYKINQGHRGTKYVGVAKNVTVQKLEAVAVALAQGKK